MWKATMLLVVGGLIGTLTGTIMAAWAEDSPSEPRICGAGEWAQEVLPGVGERSVSSLEELVRKFEAETRSDGTLSEEDRLALPLAERKLYETFVSDYLEPTRNFSMDGSTQEESGFQASVVKLNEAGDTIVAAIYATSDRDGNYTFSSAILCESQLALAGAQAEFQRRYASFKDQASNIAEGD